MPNVFEKVQLLDGYKCRVWGCGCTTGLEVHHIIPRGMQGPDELWNLITLCFFHHRQVTGLKVTNIWILKTLKYKSDFRWQLSLDWHLTRKLLKDIGNVDVTENGNDGKN